MAETRRYGLTPQLDIQQILLEAQHRWLRPAEICEILRNYQKFHIAPEPPNQPPSGSLFLFDRKILRYFRKDGHSWRKKKDGKTVKEAHERLKAGSVDVLHCYYAHGEENGNFQRRSYWMLEEDFMHIVLVHYREVQDKKETYGRTRDVEEIPHGVFGDSPSSSNSAVNYTQIPSPATDSDSRNSVQASEYEDTEPDNYQASSRYHPFTELRQFNGKSVMVDSNSQDAYFPVLPQTVQGDYQRASTSEINIYSVAQEDITKIFDESGRQLTFNGTRTQIDLPSWDAVLEQCTVGLPDASFPLSVSSVLPFNMGAVQNNETFVLDEAFASGYSSIQTDAQGESAWQELSESEASNLHTSDMGVKSAPANEGNIKYASLLKQLSLDFPSTEGDKGLQKYDSFSKWMSKELGEVDDSYLKPSSGIYWDVVGSESMVDDNCLSPQENLDTYMLSPSLSKDQLFSISNFLPSWAWAGLEIMVFVTGRFLMNKDGIHKRNWSCMFGQVEVPAVVVADGVLRCLAPAHKSGAVPFYITCSNRLACSEVREFEFRDNQEQTLDCFEFYTGSAHEMLLYTRLDKLLSGRPPRHLDMISDFFPEKAHVCKKISSLLMGTNDELSLKLKKATDEEFIADKPNDQLLQRLLKEKLHAWLLEKVLEDGKGPNVQDEEGQGVIHLASALGYDWAIAPTIAAGVKINFRDLRGWTALHWAASCGRESTIVALLSLGADPGALTDPTPDFPSGRTPADLASRNGHKGIAGFLAETSLTAHLSNLKIKEAGGSGAPGTSSTRAAENAEVRNTVQLPDGDVQSHLSLKDSLSAVRNAAQAAARIYQVYRVHSFHRKKVVEYGNDKFGMSDERALSLISVKSNKTGQHDEPAHAAAVRIQNKFRGWKGRKEFLIIRQRIVKIQAHIRGYQVRKHFRKIVWSVGIVEKAILRWRRKGNGLRGFKSEGLIEGTAMQIQTAKEDDYDFLREGRKQTEARLERALARVKSMAQYPEARDQYRRLLTGVEEFQESKLVLERILNDTEEETDVHMMFDIEELLGDDLPTPTA